MSFKRQREDEEDDGSVKDAGDVRQNDVRQNWITGKARENISARFEEAMILTNECYQAAGDDKTTPSVEMVMKFMDLIDKERKELNAYYDAQDAKRQKQQEQILLVAMI